MCCVLWVVRVMCVVCVVLRFEYCVVRCVVCVVCSVLCVLCCVTLLVVCCVFGFRCAVAFDVFVCVEC